MKTPLVVLKDVCFRYESQESFALNKVSFEIFEGEWLAIVGHNGSGKSTLAKLLNGSDKSVWDIRKQIGMVFQNPDNQFVGTTVEDDVAFGLENNGVPPGVMKKRVIDALKKVNMDAFLDQEPHHLSGGQKQRVAIAGVLALQPSIILLDEATSMLDPRGRAEVIDTMMELQKRENITVVSITHDLEEAAKADRIIMMNKGEVYREGTPDEIFQLDDELIKLGLDIPFPVKISKSLREKGIDINRHYLTEEELVAALWTSRSKM